MERLRKLLEDLALDDKFKQAMLAKAKEKFGTNLTPIPGPGWENSYRKYGNDVYLWFNTPDNSTHVVVRNIHTGAFKEVKQNSGYDMEDMGIA